VSCWNSLAGEVLALVGESVCALLFYRFYHWSAA
jgi:hypothetical protein